MLYLPINKILTSQALVSFKELLEEKVADFTAVGPVQTEWLVEDVASDEVWLRFCLLTYIHEVKRGDLVVTHHDILFNQVLDLQFHCLWGFHIVALEVKSNHVVNIDRGTPLN